MKWPTSPAVRLEAAPRHAPTTTAIASTAARTRPTTSIDEQSAARSQAPQRKASGRVQELVHLFDGLSKRRRKAELALVAPPLHPETDTSLCSNAADRQ